MQKTSLFHEFLLEIQPFYKSYGHSGHAYFDHAHLRFPDPNEFILIIKKIRLIHQFGEEIELI